MSTVRRSAATLIAVAALELLGGACVPPDTTPPPTTPPIGDVEVALTGRVDGFQRPWDLQFTPDGTPLITERGGTVARVSNGARAVVGTIADVRASGEGGLLGLAVDPEFSANGFIYTCYDSNSGSDVRVVRYRVLPAYAGLADATPIVTGIPWNGGGRHQGCRVEFGPDGDLWVTTGDGAQPTAPQDRMNLAGKVLRLHRDGSPSAANPYASNPTGGWNPLVYSYGHRNVQGIAFRPSDGAVFTVEHGTGRDDELNMPTSGANFGWNPVNTSFPGFYDESQPMTATGGVPAIWSSGDPTIAPSGATFLKGAQWGDREGQLAVAVLKGTRLSLFDIDGSTVTSVETRITDQGRLRTARMGPDGNLWLVQDASPGSLLKISPVAG
ncbi:PQQ-dependent sugar dehydrogenase [soil metagenome]